jgi:predicted transcriptional regulator
MSEETVTRSKKPDQAVLDFLAEHESATAQDLHPVYEESNVDVGNGNNVYSLLSGLIASGYVAAHNLGTNRTYSITEKGKSSRL